MWAVTIRQPLAADYLQGKPGKQVLESDTGPSDRLYAPYKYVTGEAEQRVNSATRTGYAAAVACHDKYTRYPHYDQYQVYPAAVEQYGYMSHAFDNLLYHLANRASYGSQGRTSNSMMRWKRSLSCILFKTLAQNVEDACGAACFA